MAYRCRGKANYSLKDIQGALKDLNEAAKLGDPEASNLINKIQSEEKQVSKKTHKRKQK
jgi:hypothetical protein